jgi:hypothetical protein
MINEITAFIQAKPTETQTCKFKCTSQIFHEMTMSNVSNMSSISNIRKFCYLLIEVITFIMYLL